MTADGVCHNEEMIPPKTGLGEGSKQDFRKTDINFLERDAELSKFKTDDRGKKTPMPLKDTKSTLQYKGVVL